MARRRTEWRLLQFVGLAIFVIGFVGYVVFGWRFGGTPDSTPAALAVVAVAIALVWAFTRIR